MFVFLSPVSVLLSSVVVKLTPECFSRGQHGLSDPEHISETLIDLPKHLSNLKFTVLQKMQEYIKNSKYVITAFLGIISTHTCRSLDKMSTTSLSFQAKTTKLKSDLENGFF